MIDFLAREQHHASHARPIYDALPSSVRGVFTSDIAECKSDIVAVFSYGDLRRAAQAGKRVIFGEHGVGMYYNSEHPSYAGSNTDRENVILRLSPNERHAAREREVLSCPVEVVGVPFMDRWTPKTERRRRRRYAPVVALSFHFDALVCPETRSAWKHYVTHLPQLRRDSYRLIGHGHPRIIDRLASFYRTNNIPVVPDFAKVMNVADVYVCDNSSTIFQFAYTGKPVVLLNCPFYRKDVQHEGNPRFWRHAGIGPQVDHPDQLPAAIEDAIKNHQVYKPRMEAAVRDIFTYTDGKCAARAAYAILKHVCSQ